MPVLTGITDAQLAARYRDFVAGCVVLSGIGELVLEGAADAVEAYREFGI